MKKKYFLILTALMLCFSASKAIDITFQVTMSAAPADSVWLYIPSHGEFWKGMTDDDADLTYTITVTGIEPGAQLFYSYWTSWDDSEVVPPESRFHDDYQRFIIAPETDYTIPAHAFGGNLDPLPEKVNVTFKCELQGDSAITNGVWMVNKNPWQWFELTHVGNNVFEKTWQPFKDQMMYYTFVYGGQDNWEFEESVPEECNFGTQSAPERRFDGASADSTMPVIPFGECVGPSNLVSVTYKVNMSEVTVGPDDFVWVHINPGDLWPEMSDDDADGIYEVDLNYAPGDEVFFFFAYGTWDVWDEEVVPAECADETTGHRYLMVGEEPQVLPAYLYGSCEANAAVAEYENNFSIYPNPANSAINIEFQQYFNSIDIRILDVSGRVIKTSEYNNMMLVTMPVNDLKQGIYLMQVITEQGNFTSKILIEH